tara:strand:+ start:358 stop:480 length:123 start_codon:yes stop_codon:yes gene_type:complete
MRWTRGTFFSGLGITGSEKLNSIEAPRSRAARIELAKHIH